MTRRLLLVLGLLAVDGALLARQGRATAPAQLVPLIPPLVRVPSPVDQTLGRDPGTSPPPGGLGPLLDRVARSGGAPTPAFSSAMSRFRQVSDQGRSLGEQGMQARMALEADALALADTLGDERLAWFLLHKESVARQVEAEEWVWRDLARRLQAPAPPSPRPER